MSYWWKHKGKAVSYFVLWVRWISPAGPEDRRGEGGVLSSSTSTTTTSTSTSTTTTSTTTTSTSTTGCRSCKPFMHRRTNKNTWRRSNARQHSNWYTLWKLEQYGYVIFVIDIALLYSLLAHTKFHFCFFPLVPPIFALPGTERLQNDEQSH